MIYCMVGTIGFGYASRWGDFLRSILHTKNDAVIKSYWYVDNLERTQLIYSAHRQNHLRPLLFETHLIDSPHL